MYISDNKLFWNHTIILLLIIMFIVNQLELDQLFAKIFYNNVSIVSSTFKVLIGNVPIEYDTDFISI
jgi:hypothetical protein